MSHPTRNIELRAVGDGSGSWDADRFAQVVSNLVGNAVQHSPVSTPVTVSVIDTGDEVVIEVSNEHTHAIAAEDLSRIFEPFRRGKESGGLGLGLYIVKQIAEAHGGSVAAQSHSERTTFCITLPKSSARV
ncbi:MAG: ATP-binding protein [Polyangia bacterium]